MARIKKTSDLMTEIRDSVVRYTSLNAEDFSKLPMQRRRAMIRSNRIVDYYLRAGVPWSAIERFLASSKLWKKDHFSRLPETFPVECEMSLESSYKILSLLQTKGYVRRYLQRPLEEHVSRGIAQANQPYRCFSTPYFKNLPFTEVLEVARLRTEIANMPNSQERQQKMRKMFLLATQMGKEKRFEYDMLKKAYTEVLTTPEGCQKAYKMLGQIEKGGVSQEQQEEIDYGSPWALAAARVNRVEAVVKKVACHVNYDLLKQAAESVALLKLAQEEKNKGKDIGPMMRRAAWLHYRLDK